MFASIIFFLIILFGLILNEFVSRKFLIPAHFSRKMAHIFSALIVFAMPFFLSKNEIIIIAVIFAIILFLTRRKNIFSSIHSVERKTFGEIFLPMGVALCAFCFLPQKTTAFQFGILIMGISDALASIFGEKFGKHIIKLFGHKKSIEGSAVFFISSTIIALFFTSGFNYCIFSVAIILTFTELVSVIGLDNLILPVLGAYMIQFIK
ncbi:MAG: hypothetical protein PHI53_00625 [Candidatus Pacebacteria bacterium]|nr:hypothetical protein [Candidatus Paceibacterota bacterium]